MNTETAEIFLQCHRPGMRREDARIEKAVKVARRDEKLKAKLEAQTEFDQRLVDEIDAIEVPSDLPNKLDAHMGSDGARKFDWGGMFRQPAFLAVVIAVLVLAGWGIYFAWNRRENFPGRENVARLVEINEEMTGVELEPKSAELGNLEDWLFSKYGFEGFYVPAPLAKFTTVGARVFKQDGQPAAQIAIEKNNMICYMFSAASFGVEIAPENQWRVFVDEAWVAAVQEHGGRCFMIAFRGVRADMDQFLAGLR